MSRVDPNIITGIVRETARLEILPRFGALSDHEIAEKAPGDLVTIADKRSEERLFAELTALLPGSRVVGEELTETDPDSLGHLRGEPPVWIVDPLDGTRNFANGEPCFAVIVALAVNGETVAGWIHDPLADRTVVAERGAGAWEAGRRLSLEAAPAFEEMVGALGSGLRRRFSENRLSGRRAGKIVRYGSSGREHMDLARGSLHFARYGGGIKPWDHAAGTLIHAEAGGYSALWDTQEPYEPSLGIVRGMLLFAPDRDAWREIASILAHWSGPEV